MQPHHASQGKDVGKKPLQTAEKGHISTQAKRQKQPERVAKKQSEENKEKPRVASQSTSGPASERNTADLWLENEGGTEEFLAPPVRDRSDDTTEVLPALLHVEKENKAEKNLLEKIGEKTKPEKKEQKQPAFDLSFFEVEKKKLDDKPAANRSTLAKSQKTKAKQRSAEFNPATLKKDPVLEKIISVIIANPEFGPSAIRQMLITMKLTDESLTRSDIYKILSNIDLHTRAKRIAFAQANSL